MLPSQRKGNNEADVTIKIEGGEAEVITAPEGIILHIMDMDNEQLQTYDGDTLIEKRPM